MHIVAIHYYYIHMKRLVFSFPDLNQDSGSELEEANFESSGTASVETMTLYLVVGNVLS